jgi:citrate lyase gamma subunit
VGRYVRQHKAFFYQVLTDKAEPFHYYIRIDGKAAIALNMKFFNSKIDKAVRRVKKELSLEYDISEEEIQKIIDERVGEETNKAIEREMESAVNESIKEAIRQTIGQELSNMLVSAVEQATGEAIDSAIEQELADAIDQEIALAVEMGIDEAAVTAGWEAYFEVLAQGGTYEEANAAAYDACGSACDNY